MSVTGPEAGPVRSSRAERHADRRRRMVIAAIAIIAILALVLGIVLWGGDDGAPAAGPTGGASPTPGAQQTLAFQVSKTTAPMMAVVGRGTEPVAMPYPQDVTVVMPGRGETTASDVAGLPGESMRIALSNMSGTWLAHYAVVPVGELAAAVERSGGLTVALPVVYPTKVGDLGPGTLTMSGAQLKAFLTGTTDDAAARWEIALKALLADPPAFEPGEIAESDDEAAAAAVFDAAAGAGITDVPTKLITTSITVPDYEALDATMHQLFETPTPVPAIVLNGTGEPGTGEGVAARIIPVGFRITLSKNAESFDVETTDVFANGVEHEDSAKRARQALQVGRVQVSQVPSGIGDITIVVGKDFTVDGN